MISDKLRNFIENQGISIRRFEEECGITQGLVNRIVSGKSKIISESIMDAISNRYPSFKSYILNEPVTEANDYDVSYGSNKNLTDIIRSNILLAESNKMLAEANKMLVDTNRELVLRVLS